MARKIVVSARVRSVVSIGSRNRAKTEGVRRAFKHFLRDVDFKELDVTAMVKNQPMNMDETVKGARQRAELAVKTDGADFGVGVEAGLVELAEGFFLNVQIAAIVDSSGRLSFGCSSGFPIPSRFVERLRKNYEELDRYCPRADRGQKVARSTGWSTG